jgi:hypothetical protein|eukprot:CAMPEP_0174290994 /NCGR_PEP_ID=MMETSP0809-20121228/30765_1 /TAXON_ID=73025 ORGANISM="Eutreptiella gymnastica-like, Strain CCMP1594" /NCGR_SAMPLE_ID=MMETSP0809 /ASSEMBLY_ACC=CAM_ASM_000658 /LENGTH=112 /DNA_ID=CAMNT_0015390075 /DNA_START=21 /DNA_END=359 /DNA_ORIENTATION=+
MAGLIDKDMSIEEALRISRYQGATAKNPKLLCHETRNKRDICQIMHGRCGYYVEEHFDCLLQYYKKEKVDKLREVYRSQSFEMVKPFPKGDYGINAMEHECGAMPNATFPIP